MYIMKMHGRFIGGSLDYESVVALARDMSVPEWKSAITIVEVNPGIPEKIRAIVKDGIVQKVRGATAQ